MVALRSLESSPTRCPVAREADLFPELDLRQLVFGRIRILFAIFTCAFGAVLVLTPRFFARHMGGFVVMVLVALAMPIMTLVLSTVTLRDCLSITALCFFPVLMQILLVLNARTQVPAA